MEFYIPQRNKAQKKVAGHREIADELKKKSNRNRRERLTMEYNYSMVDVWQLELERLNFKIHQTERN